MSTCSEFMVGDWLQDENQFPMQVRIVGEDYLYADFEGNEGDMWEFDDKIESPYPIPLTEEILKKNGFFQKLINSKNFEFRVNEKVYLRYNLDSHKFNKMCIIEYKKFDKIAQQILFLCRCKYVHELQQALRLAMLNEIADNFKI